MIYVVYGTDFLRNNNVNHHAIPIDSYCVVIFSGWEKRIIGYSKDPLTHPYRRETIRMPTLREEIYPKSES